MAIKKVGIIGAGVMGCGIARVPAGQGLPDIWGAKAGADFMSIS
ncbi:hypothetical protein [Pseudomonas sp.]|nr:hypothetical protein [Pseudomonas sp.]